MKYSIRTFDVLHNFISPVTGRIRCKSGYILEGDENGIATPSSILLDMQLDFINIRAHYDYLATADFIVGFPNKEIPKAQVLSKLQDGILKHNKGIVGIAVAGTDYVGVNSFQDWIDKVKTAIDNIKDLYDFITKLLEDEAVEQLEHQIFKQQLTSIEANLDRIYAELLAHTQSIELLENQVTLLMGQIEALQTQFASLELELAGVVAEVTVLSAAIGVLQTEVIALTATVAGLSEAIAVIEGEIAGLTVGLAGLGATVTGQGFSIFTLQLAMLSKVGQAEINSAINNLKLNNIAINGNLDLHNYNITNLSLPINPYDGATKAYVDSGDLVLATTIADLRLNGLLATDNVNLSGFQLLNLSVPTVATNAVTKAYADAIKAALLATINAITLNSLSAAGNVNLASYKLINVAMPTSNADGANKKYVDDAINALPAPTAQSIGLTGDIIGTGQTNASVITSFNVTKDFDVTNHKIVNVADAQVDTDAANLNTVWNLLNDNCEIIWL